MIEQITMPLSPGVLVVMAGLLDLADPSVTYSQLGLHTRPGHVDMWTMAESGQVTRRTVMSTCSQKYLVKPN